MDMDQSAVFLAGSILTALGMIVFVIALVVINNIIHKYWKPLGWFKWSESMFGPVHYVEQEKIPPSLEPEGTKKKS
jgi:hypothetical protein